MIDKFTCFKYRTGESALRCLVDGALYFASPSTLNDTLESKFDFHDPEANIRIVESTLSEVSQAKGGPSGLRFDKSVRDQFVVINTEENLVFKQACDRAGIFSAAQKPNNQALWAYYANNGSGFCFELEWTIDAFKKFFFYPVYVNYVDSKRVFNRFDDWRIEFLLLASENPSLSLQQLQDIAMEEPFRRRQGMRATGRALAVKHTDWQHENEVRLIAPRAGAAPILKDVLKRIHYMRRDFPEWGEVLKTIHLQYPGVELVEGEFRSDAPSGVYSVREIKSVPIVD